MKFNALVVAAMVITSSMQLGREDFGAVLGSVVGRNQEWHGIHKAYGQKSGMSQIPSDNELGPGLSQGPSGNGWKKLVRDIESQINTGPTKVWVESSSARGAHQRIGVEKRSST
ncbi:hypothetical protein BASA60_000746 [Batrachochytrium salamandrivorans]|nr:hypothetical protein BASA60_000746 [Batrachochytrium salamandrivorans]